MAIDTTSEQLLTFTEACKVLPRRRRGKRPSLQTLYRWASKGCRGIKLEFVCIGGTRCTSREALQRFFDRLTEQAQASTAAAAPAEADPAREADIRRAERALDAAGV